jgi:hypothetical protein
MSQIAHTTDGHVIQWMSPLTPPHAISYDSHSNPTLYSDVYADPTAYLVVDGVLTKDGVPVTINPPCSDCQVLDAVVGDVPATVEQLQAAVRLLILKPGFQRG